MATHLHLNIGTLISRQCQHTAVSQHACDECIAPAVVGFVMISVDLNNLEICIV